MSKMSSGQMNDEAATDIEDQSGTMSYSGSSLNNVSPIKKTRFSQPQDVLNEKVNFDGTALVNNASAEGNVTYGSDSAISNNEDSIRFQRQTQKIRRKSTQMRKDIPDCILLTSQDLIDDDLGTDVGSQRRRMRSETATYTPICLHRSFLDPSYSLQKQMLLTFGLVSSLTILLVMIVSIIASVVTGNTIKEESNTNVIRWVNEYRGTLSQHLAETLSPKIMPNDVVDLMVEIVRDRFRGYPITEDDSKTPFFDIQTQTNVYPLQKNPLPMDWDFRHTPNENMGNVNSNNYFEHMQDRFSWYAVNRLSTESAFYTMQGACDPNATNSSAMAYYPNCTDANNDLSTGGVVAPTPTNEQVARKAADLSPFLKALFEYHQDIADLGYYFSNGGAGSSFMFPHYELDQSSNYTSIGCDWMRTPNPIDPNLGPIGTEEEIARCHPNGSVVPIREYNPLERWWCRDQALNPNRAHNMGPYTSSWSTDVSWLMSTGRAVYDAETSALISCIFISFTLDGINKILKEVRVDELGVMTIVRNNDEGTVITSQQFDFEAAPNATTVVDTALVTGVTRKIFEKIKSLVDFSGQWDPHMASIAYKTGHIESEDHIISAYPMPPIPAQYDGKYRPEFFVIFSMPKTFDILQTADDMSRAADESVRDLVLFTVIVGVVGFVIFILLIFATASWFVDPLKWMRHVGDQIIGNFGQELDANINYNRKNSLLYSPKTELDSLVDEFSKMITRFSGEGTAKRMDVKDQEKTNIFNFSDEFAGLYQSRKVSAFKFGYPSTAASPSAIGGTLEKCNLGPNTATVLSSERKSRMTNFNKAKYSSKEVHRSPIFLWMTGLVVTPLFPKSQLLVTTIVISTVVLRKISHELPSTGSLLKEEYMLLRDAYRFAATGILSIRASGVLEKAARDAHILTRFAAWLFFGGIQMSSSFTELLHGGAEYCKTAPSATECEWGIDLPCDCAWNDFNVRMGTHTCTPFSSGSRHLQKLFFEGESQDTDSNGSRNSTSYPKVATSPDTTAWWDNIMDLPGSTANVGISNYGTSYNRVITFSALSTIIFPLYNYDVSDDKSLGLYGGFEADGLTAGYAGCDYSWFTSVPFWVSSAGNGAAEIRNETCPVGKYGYDPRCRSWYEKGRVKALSGKGHLHITAPYLFASGEAMIGQSMTSPLIDPNNQNYIGQVLVDFLPNSIFRMFQSLSTDPTEWGSHTTPIMITPESDILGHDTVWPLSPLDKEGRAIKDLLQADELFDPILEDMKAGGKGNGIFSLPVGNNQEKYDITYAPVVVRNYRPLNSSDIGSGVEQQNTTAFSLAFLDSKVAVARSFQDIDGFVSKTVNICIGVLSALVVISTIIVVYIAFQVATSMTKPILELLDLIRDINREHLSEDDVALLSDYEGSCREIEIVYNTMECLYRVVQYANIAFYSGDLEVAYQVLRDALRLFTRLDNKKAIAVASNNLGNMMLTFYRSRNASDEEEMCNMTMNQVISKGTAYYAHSIKLGEEAYDKFYDEQGWSEECLVFMQFLANRYFNRGIFFLTTRDDHANPIQTESLGFRDVDIAADMDVEIVDQCLEMGFGIDRVERFELMMSRVRGLISLVELGYSPDDLGIEEKINDVYRYLINAMKNPSHELFKDISPTGRMQKLDVELIKYYRVVKEDNVDAARVSIRMLIEDEYLFPRAEEEATKMLLFYMRNSSNDENCPYDKDGSIKKELESVVHTLKDDYLKSRNQTSLKNPGSAGVMRSISTWSSKKVGDTGSEGLSSKGMSASHSSAVRESGRADVTMELF